MRSWMLLVLAYGAADSTFASDPVQIRNDRAASLAFLRLPSRSHTLEERAARISYSLVGANEFRKIGPIDEDAESWRFAFGYRQGLKHDLEFFTEIPLTIRGGGFLDPIIDWWHNDVLGDPNPIRESTERGRSIISYPGASPFGSGVGVSDMTVGIAKQLQANIVGSTAVKLPFGNPSTLTGSGAFDLGFAIDVRIPLSSRFTLDLNGSTVLQGASERLGDVRRSIYSSNVSATWNQNSRDSWSLIWSSEQSPIKTGDAMLDQDHRVISVAYSRRASDETQIDVFFSEDGDFRWFRFPGGASVGPDITIGFRISRALKTAGQS